MEISGAGLSLQGLPMSGEQIKARFYVTKKAVTIFAIYHEASVTIRWPRGKDNERHIRTLVANLETLLQEGINEVFVQDQANRLDFEIESLFLESDEDRPDES